MNFDELMIFHQWAEDPILCGGTAIEVWRGLASFAELSVTLPKADIWQSYVLQKLWQDENLFTKKAQRVDSLSAFGNSLLEQLQKELRFIQQLYQEAPVLDLQFTPLAGILVDTDVVSFDSTPDWGALVEVYFQRVKKHGIGLLAKHGAFGYRSGQLWPLSFSMPIQEKSGYEDQRAVLQQNTESFLAGQRANNILLYGDRGTGKSSMVKSLLPLYQEKGLRLVELVKSDLQSIPELVRILAQSSLKFILFLDDLAFADGDTSYLELKPLLEGGLSQTNNLLVYATTNRRHLVKEWASERGVSSELHAKDSMEEKLALADRFGITLFFGQPDQSTYFALLSRLKKHYGLTIPDEMLQKEAVRWPYNARSVRTAHQLLQYLAAENLKS